MSLGVVVKGTEGVVLAADSRVTLQAQRLGHPHPLPINFDNASKLLSFTKPHTFVGAVTYGAAIIGKRTAHSFMPEFERDHLADESKRLKIGTYANKLSEFFLKRWQESTPPDYSGPDMTFIVAGYDEGEAYGNVFLFGIPSQPEPLPRNDGKNEFGMTWGGQLEIASRLIQGFDPALIPIIKGRLKLNDQQLRDLVDDLRKNLEFPIPYDILPLQDCVDLAIFMIRTTIAAQHLGVGLRGVGGPIEVAIITRTKEIGFLQKKETHGEAKTQILGDQ